MEHRRAAAQHDARVESVDRGHVLVHRAQNDSLHVLGERELRVRPEPRLHVPTGLRERSVHQSVQHRTQTLVLGFCGGGALFEVHPPCRELAVCRKGAQLRLWLVGELVVSVQGRAPD